MVEPNLYVIVPPEVLFLLIAIIIWSAVWKAIAMWHSARNKQVAWFVIFCIFNTIGLLEILYMAFWRKNKNQVMPVIVQEIPKPSKSVKAAKKKPAKKRKR